VKGVIRIPFAPLSSDLHRPFSVRGCATPACVCLRSLDVISLTAAEKTETKEIPLGGPSSPVGGATATGPKPDDDARRALRRYKLANQPFQPIPRNLRNTVTRPPPIYAVKVTDRRGIFGRQTPPYFVSRSR
jgi:hypothetical protein